MLEKDKEGNLFVSPLGQIMCEIFKVRDLIIVFGIINIILIISCLLITLIR